MSLNIAVDNLATKILTAHQDLQGVIEEFPTLLGQAMSVELFVDPDLGNDGNDGLSWASAKATINSAVRKIPIGGYGKINLIKGKVYELDNQITCGNRLIFIDGNEYENYTGTYATIRGRLNPHTSLVNYLGFNIGQNGFLYIRSCRLETARYPAGVTHLTHTDYATSLLNTNSGWGTFFLEHCQVILNNGPLMHQHSAGSFGCADLYMREITVTRTPVEELADTRRSAVLMGTHGNAPISFKLYAYRIILNNIATLKELFTQTLMGAKSNVV